MFLVFGNKGTTTDLNAAPERTTSDPSTTSQPLSRDVASTSQHSSSHIKEHFMHIAEPIQRAAVDHRDDPKSILPTDAEVEAAMQSNSLASKESLFVLEKLKKGYAKYNMPFPSFRDHLTPTTSAEPQFSPDAEAVQQWITSTVQSVKDEVSVQGGSPQDFLPSDEEQEIAIRSGSFNSKEFLLVLEILEKSCEKLQIQFPAPPRYVASAEPSNVEYSVESEPVSANAAERQIINAYFEAQTQRIQLEAKKKSIEVTGCLPTEEDIQNATRSESISSEVSLAALQKIEACYTLLGLPFYSPIQK
ncbi:MAG: hypothetical protein VX278_15385 [Myxococcota bacterium]|nr:hypothetical protein [Myxococcota bacterium]